MYAVTFVVADRVGFEADPCPHLADPRRVVPLADGVHARPVSSRAIAWSGRACVTACHAERTWSGRETPAMGNTGVGRWLIQASTT